MLTRTPDFSFSLLSLFAELLELGDVALVVIGDVRDHHPVAVQVGAGDLLDARERFGLDRPELGEIDLRPRQQAEPRSVRSAWRGTWRQRRRLGEIRDVLRQDAPAPSAALDLAQVDAALARKLAHRWPGIGNIELPSPAAPAAAGGGAARRCGGLSRGAAAAGGGGCRRRLRRRGARCAA